MMRSRVTLAMIEAAAIDRHLESPLTMARVWHSRFGVRLPSIRATAGDVSSLRTAWRMAHKVAFRILIRSMRSGSAIATATAAVSVMRVKRTSRSSRVQGLGIRDAGWNFLRVQDHRRCDHRASPRTTTGFIDSGDGAIAQLDEGGFQFETRSVVRISAPHGRIVRGPAVMSKRFQVLVST